MSEESYFNKALANFTYDVACGGAIRHMADKGYTVKQISERLDYPVSYEKIQRTVCHHLLEKGILRSELPDFSEAAKDVEYIREYDRFGHSSFRKKEKERTAPIQNAEWKKCRFSAKNGEELQQFLSRKARENGEEYSYISCDFGMYGESDKLYGYLDSRQREYIHGILWQKKRMYHRLDYRMMEIARKLFLCDDYEMICYFGKTGEEIAISPLPSFPKSDKLVISIRE